MFAFDQDFPLDSLPKWIKEKEDEYEKNLNLNEKLQYENKHEL